MRLMRLVALASFLCIAVGTASAHEFIVVPEEWHSYQAGRDVPLSVYSTHVFVRSEELEPEGFTELYYQGRGLSLAANKGWLTYDGKVTLAGGGAAVIGGHRLPMLYSKTPSGGADGGRDVNPDAMQVSSYEKFAKLILPVDGKTEGFNKPLGHRLEIVPMSDPFAVNVGDEISFRVLLDGKPAIFDMVYATYSGFSDIPNAWAFCASPVSHGEARVKITAPGMWVVRVGVVLNEKSKTHDAVDLKAVLTFPVR